MNSSLEGQLLKTSESYARFRKNGEVWREAREVWRRSIHQARRPYTLANNCFTHALL